MLKLDKTALFGDNTMSKANADALVDAINDIEMINPDWSGALADGVTDDSDAFITAIAQMGVNGTMVLSANRTYIIRKRLNLLSGQKLNLNGSTIKRGDALSASFSQSVTGTGKRNITVTSLSGLEVGHEVLIVPANNSNYNTSSKISDLLKIESINSNTITVDKDITYGGGASTGTWNIGAIIFTKATMFSFNSSAEGQPMHFYNGTIDGNKSNNTFLNDWRCQDSLSLRYGGGIHIENMKFINSPTETITLGSNAWVRNVEFRDINGSMVHFSDAGVNVIKGFYCSQVKGDNIRIKGNIAGHGNSAFEFSLGVKELDILNCNIKTINGGIFGTPHSSTFSNRLNIIGNTFEDALYVSDINGNTPVSAPADEDFLQLININGNKFINCDILKFTAETTLAERTQFPVNKIRISNNDFINTNLSAIGVSDIDITGNKFHVRYGYGSGFVTFNEIINNTLIYIEGEFVNVKGNKIYLPNDMNNGAQRAIVINSFPSLFKNSGGADTEGSFSQNIDVEDNKIYNSPLYGIIINGIDHNSYNGASHGCSIKRNKLILGTSEPSKTYGIVVNPEVNASDNEVYLREDLCVGIFINGAISADQGLYNGGKAMNNTVHGTVNVNATCYQYGEGVNGFNIISKDNMFGNDKTTNKGLIDNADVGSKLILNEIDLPLQDAIINIKKELFQNGNQY